MGQSCDKCSRKKQDSLIRNDEREIERELYFKSYSSSSDYIFKKIEENFMVLKYFQLFELSQLITNIKTSVNSIEISTDRRSFVKTYLEDVEFTDFDIFIENRILKNNIVRSLMSNKDDALEIFKEFIGNLFRLLMKSRKDYFLHKNGEGKRVKKGSLDYVKKLHLYALAVLYSTSTNKGKVEWLFNLLSDDNRTFAKNQNLDEFLFFLFMIPSLVGINALSKTAEKYTKKINELNQEEYIKATDAFEPKDIIRLKSIFLIEFFENQEVLTKAEYEKKFESDLYGWIFDPRGIRALLEKHNDVQVESGADDE